MNLRRALLDARAARERQQDDGPAFVVVDREGDEQLARQRQLLLD